MFADLEPYLTSAEITPRDLYELAIFDTDYVKPDLCEKADPDLPFVFLTKTRNFFRYCQLTGQYRLPYSDLYNTITPYENYGLHCGTQPPTGAKYPTGC